MDKLLRAAQDVVIMADDTGCDGNLTVTSKTSVERLEREIIKRNKLSFNERVSSDWVCPDCRKKSKGHTFAWLAQNGTVTCDCGSDMILHAINIDGETESNSCKKG